MKQREISALLPADKPRRFMRELLFLQILLLPTFHPRYLTSFQ